MQPAVFVVHEGLLSGSRLPVLAHARQQISLRELAALLLMGSAAALTASYLDFGLRIPGHAILRAVFPMALGMALAPRRLGGSVMGTGALITLAILRVTAGRRLGAGAAASLLATGPLLDLALAGARSGWRLYLGFVLAGLGSNLAALAIRGGAKFLSPADLVGRPLADWWQIAAFTYPLCGVVAGLVSALVWFRLHRRPGSKCGMEDAS